MLSRGLYWFRKQYYRLIFKEFGKTSLLRKPTLVVGAQFITVGEGCCIQQGARIEAICKWREQRFEPSICIADRVSIGQNCHLTCGSKLVIEEGCAILPNVCITDINHLYDDVEVGPNEAGISVNPVHIGKESVIGFGSAVLPGVRIGKHCVVGANSVVTHDIPDYCVAIGAPAHAIKRFDREKKQWVAVNEVS